MRTIGTTIALLCGSQQKHTIVLCNIYKINFMIKNLKSVYGRDQWDTGSSNASFASQTTTVFPWIPI
jgi:hypothetical protein